MKKETRIQVIDYGNGEDDVTVHYSQLVGTTSRGNFKITMDRMKFYRINKAEKLIEYLEDGNI